MPQCCELCLKTPECNSWTVSAEAGPSGGVPTCHLQAPTGEEQRRHNPKSGDCRYTSGYLVHPHHETDEGSTNIMLALAAIGVLYCIGGIGINAAFARRENESKPLSALLPHATFWAEVGGLVIDGITFTICAHNGKPASGAPVSTLNDRLVSHEGAVQ